MTIARDAASVLLLRDGADGVEVWVLTRARGMAFAAGMTAFPGGRVEAGDEDLPWTGTPAAQFARRFGCGETEARSYLGAAVREVFEETGVLLTDRTADLAEHREAVEAGDVSFGDLLRRNGLAADASAIRAWARWITPEGLPRRYDTRFFVAALPDGAEARHVTTESSMSAWVPAAEVLAQYERGERNMLMVTEFHLRAVASLGTVAEVLDAAAGMSCEPVRPDLGLPGYGVDVTLPGGTRW